MSQPQSAHNIVSFGIVELNVPLPYHTLLSMSPSDPLYAALVEAWKNKQKREDYRTGLLCAVMANCMGSGKKQYQPKDFMPKNSETEQDINEEDIKANFIKYNAKRESGLVK